MLGFLFRENAQSYGKVFEFVDDLFLNEIEAHCEEGYSKEKVQGTEGNAYL